MIDEFDEYPVKKGPPSWLWPSILVVLSLAVGFLLSNLLHAPSPEPAPEPAPVAEIDTATEDEPPPKSEREQLQEIQTEVENLKALLGAREEELGRYQEKEIKDEKRRNAAAVRWKAMEAEIEDLKTRLEEAETERDQLLNELKLTVLALDEQIVKTERAKEVARVYKRKSVENLWAAFSAEAKLKICDRGSKRRHLKCHDAVDTSLNVLVQDRFQECVNTFQATPLLLQAEKDEDLPMFAETLDDENRFLKKGWYIQYCDPTLPEAGDPIEDL
ncbi:MAG: hypothetical protein VX519_00285 [Myxococcota bacterium]|nr:hypothetical protein [Myxococcota bacterium]